MKKCICIVVRNGDRFLLVKHGIGPWHHNWFFPGMITGHEDTETLHRELLQRVYLQTGYVIDIRKLLFSEYYNDVSSHNRALYIYVTGSIIGGRIKTRPTKHSDQTSWTTRSGMTNLNMVISIPQAVTRYRQIFRWLEHYQSPVFLIS